MTHGSANLRYFFEDFVRMERFYFWQRFCWGFSTSVVRTGVAVCVCVCGSWRFEGSWRLHLQGCSSLRKEIWLHIGFKKLCGREGRLKEVCVTGDFRREVAENCTLLGCYAASGGNSLIATHCEITLNRAVLVLTLRRLMSYIYGAPILDVSRSHTTTQHSR